MFTHADIWRAIDRLAAEAGFSPSGLAKRAGLDPTTFNKSKRVSADGKPRWPSTESIAKILSVAGMTMSDFFALVDAGGAGADEPVRTVPVLATSRAGKKGHFDSQGRPVGKAWDKIGLDGLYAVEIDDDALAPLYKAGEIVMASPGADVRRGDRVLVGLTNGRLRAGTLARQTAGAVELKESGALDTKDIAFLARILWTGQ